MASVLHAQLPVFVFSLSLLVSSAIGARVVCEQLTAELCAFAVSSTSRRCVLENTHCAGRPTEYQCRTSEVVVQDGRLSGLVETDGCVRACGVDRATVGISSDSLLDPRVAGAVCSPACLRGCPNIVDLYSNLAAGEGTQWMWTEEASRYMSQAGNLDRVTGGQSDTQSGTEGVLHVFLKYKESKFIISEIC